MRKNLFLWLSVVWAIVILYKAVTPFALPVGIPIFPHIDKAFHVGAFGILAALVFLSNTLTRTRVVLVAVVYGVVIEVIQIFVGRSADILDIVADATGAVLAVQILWMLKDFFPELKFIPKRKRQA